MGVQGCRGEAMMGKAKRDEMGHAVRARAEAMSKVQNRFQVPREATEGF